MRRYAGDADSLEITTKAVRDAQAIGYSLEDIVDAVQSLKPNDFVKSEKRIVRGTRRFGTTPTISPSTACTCI
jgi:hypothetical protein